MPIFPDRKYKFWLDLDNLKSKDELNNILALLKHFGKYTTTMRTKKDGTLSFHIVYYETVFSLNYILELR